MRMFVDICTTTPNKFAMLCTLIKMYNVQSIAKVATVHPGCPDFYMRNTLNTLKLGGRASFPSQLFKGKFKRWKKGYFVLGLILKDMKYFLFLNQEESNAYGNKLVNFEIDRHKPMFTYHPMFGIEKMQTILGSMDNFNRLIQNNAMVDNDEEQVFELVDLEDGMPNIIKVSNILFVNIQ